MASKRTIPPNGGAGTEVAEPELHVFFMNTTKLEKIEQLNAQAKNRHYPVLFLPVTALGKPSHSPEELTGNFHGNKNEKLASCARHLAGFEYEAQVIPALASLGISREAVEQGKIKLYGAAEDSGFAFDRGNTGATQEFIRTFFNTGKDGPYRAQADKELVESLKQFSSLDKGRYNSFPGVETVRVMGAAGGVDNFFRLVELAMAKMGIDTQPAARSTNKLDYMDTSTLGAFAWNPRSFNPKKAGYISGEGESRSTHYRQDTGELEITTYAFTAPTGRHSRGDMTSRASLGPLYQPQARGDAMGELVKQLGIHAISKNTWRERVTASGTRHADERKIDYHVAVLPADQDYSHNGLANAVIGAVRSKGWDAELPKDANNRTRVWARGGMFQDMLDGSDSVLFLPHGSDSRKQGDNSRMLEQVHAVSQFLEHATLYPEGKAKLGVFVEEKPGDYEAFIKPFVALFNRGAFGDRPTTLVKKASSVDEAMKMLAEHHDHYRPVLVEREPDVPVPILKHKTGKYNVCVFLSASMEGIFEEKAYGLGGRLERANMGLVYGAADRHAMGAVFKGVLDAAKDAKRTPKVLGSTTHVIAATECATGTKPADLPDNMFYLAPNIPKRKEFLFKNSDAFVVLEGGVGSLDELLTYMYYREHEPETVKDKPMVICESAYTDGAMYKQALDAYLGRDTARMNEDTRNAMLKEKGIYVVKPARVLHKGDGNKKLFDYDLDKVMEVLEEDRRERWADIVEENRKLAATQRSFRH